MVVALNYSIVWINKVAINFLIARNQINKKENRFLGIRFMNQIVFTLNSAYKYFILNFPFTLILVATHSFV